MTIPIKRKSYGILLRKSLSSGPFRINFSKNGISYSVGVKGARINSCPRGTYVNIGANGIYYRKKIGNITNQPNLQPIVPEHSGVHSITSASIDQLTDIDSKAFIDELTEKANKISYVNWFGFLPLVIFLTVLFTYSFEGSEVITQQEADRHIAIIDSYGLFFLGFRFVNLYLKGRCSLCIRNTQHKELNV